MKKPINEQSQSYFEKRSLSKAQLDDLQLLLQKKQSQKDERPKNIFSGRWFLKASVAACIAVFAMIIMLRPVNMLNAISEEVVYNHIKQMPLELETNNFSNIGKVFSKLDFSPLQSEFFAQNNYAMLGGRYCSIQGVTAVQLQYQAQDVVSLYQVAYDKSLYGRVPSYDQKEKPYVNYVRGYRVEVWREGGVLMACVTKA